MNDTKDRSTLMNLAGYNYKSVRTALDLRKRLVLIIQALKDEGRSDEAATFQTRLDRMPIDLYMGKEAINYVLLTAFWELFPEHKPKG